MVARRILHTFQKGSTPSSAGLCCLLAPLVFYAGLAKADEETPEITISRLEFRVSDAQPGAGPVRSFRYGYEIFTAGQKESLHKRDIAYQSEDGILRITDPTPPFGRVRVWVNADDGQQRYRTGYAAFSYQIDATKAAQPPTISLQLGIVVTGKVLDAQSGMPIPVAEVAPMQWGHHFNWADWDHSTKTDREGKYRITTSSALGVAARHSDYREAQMDDRTSSWTFEPGHNVRKKTSWSEGEPQPQEKVGPDGFVFRLHPLIAVRGRLVAPDGKPITAARVYGFARGDYDKEGRFILKVTREEWNEQEKRKVEVYTDDYRPLEATLKSFSLEGESVFSLQPEARIEGQILDAIRWAASTISSNS